MNMLMTDAYSGFTIDFSRMNINEKSLLDMQTMFTAAMNTSPRARSG